MLRSFQAKFAIALIGLWVGLPAFPIRAGDVSYPIYMDTSSIENLTGYLTMDFLASVIPTVPAEAKVTGFYSDGSLLPDLILEGDVSGTLSTDVTMHNQTAPSTFNSFSQAMTFGKYLGFTLTISSDVLDNPDPLSESGTTFALYVFDRVEVAAGPPPEYGLGDSLFVTGDPGGAVLGVELCDCGILTVFPYSPVVTVPEPGTVLLSLLGATMLIGHKVVRKRRAA